METMSGAPNKPDPSLFLSVASPLVMTVKPSSAIQQHVLPHHPQRFFLGQGGMNGSHSLGLHVSPRRIVKRCSHTNKASSLSRAHPSLQMSKMAFYVSPPTQSKRSPKLAHYTLSRSQPNALLPHSQQKDCLTDLPYELAMHVLSYLDLPDLLQVSQLSRSWHMLYRSDDVWRPRLVSAHQEGRWSPIPSKLALMGNELLHVYQQRHQLDKRWASGSVVTYPLFGHGNSVYCSQFDDTKIMTGSRDHTIKAWDMATLRCVHTLRGHSGSVLCLQYNASIMVSGSSDHSLIVWDMNTFQPLRQLKGHRGGVVGLSMDDRYIVSCSKDSTIMIWDIHTFELLRVIQAHHGAVNGVQLHGDRIVSAGSDSLVKMWDVHSGACLREFVGHTRGLACVQFDGKQIVSGSNDRTIRVWNAETGECSMVCEGHVDLVRTLHFKDDRIVSASYDQSVRVWDAKTGACLLNFQCGHKSWVLDVQFDKKRIISASQDHTALVMNFSHGLDTRYL
ncbi:WD40 repeat-like protein [Hesseltinella vesiculosa]|uniref:WD40 repeat-like protein n=1 Tax=Hesseltinella vesiculosa TaxID=101127 RepID=A0A1X2GBF5_9FUNG|nr:WD40 repeat-like protein [Hesseltinella vesiculosa]